jgi:hypothetical protein
MVFRFINNLNLKVMKNYNKARAMAQINAIGLKSAKIEAGTKVVVGEIVEQETKLASGISRISDYALCSTPKGNVRVPIAELLKMRTADDAQVFKTEDGSDNIALPSEFTIASSKDRVDRDGHPIFPLFAYNLNEAFVKGEVKTWAELREGGLKEGKFSPVQDYTVAL